MNARSWLLVLLAAASLAFGMIAGRWAGERSDDASGSDSRPAPTRLEAGDRGEPVAPASLSPRHASASTTDLEATSEPEPSGEPAGDDRDLTKLLDALETAPGGKPEGERGLELRMALESLWLDLRGTRPTALPDGRGELTHPSVVARVVRGALERAGRPLDGARTDELTRLDREFSAELERVLERDNRPEISRLVDEIDLKHELAIRVLELLDAEQRAVVAPLFASESASSAGALSPLQLARVHERELAPAELEGFRAGFERELAREFDVSEALARSLALELARDLAPLLGARAAAELSRMERVILAGDAQAALLEKLLARPGLDAATRERILRLDSWMVPRVVE